MTTSGDNKLHPNNRAVLRWSDADIDVAGSNSHIRFQEPVYEVSRLVSTRLCPSIATGDTLKVFIIVHPYPRLTNSSSSWKVAEDFQFRRKVVTGPWNFLNDDGTFATAVIHITSHSCPRIWGTLKASLTATRTLQLLAEVGEERNFQQAYKASPTNMSYTGQISSPNTSYSVAWSALNKSLPITDLWICDKRRRCCSVVAKIH